ncbi:MAG: glycoside hydrolase family 27 protein [Opitutaceae bacterium]|nr:glycoside hydrolase family 27 protein [Opitutaceae bacterium]
MKPHHPTVLLALILSIALPASARPRPELAASPPMGWNSWNWFGKKSINEQVVRETVDAMVSSGLRDAGYTFVVVDGGWRDTQLAPDGGLRSHPERFPGGMKALADYAHSRGLKFGLHTVPGTHDCGGDPVGGLGHEEVQMKQFVDWGLDFLKIDRCRNKASGRSEDNGWTEDVVKAVYTKWSGLIEHCGRDMVFSISAYRFRDWYPQTCHMARTTYDIEARVTGGAVFDDGLTDNRSGKFHSVMNVVELNNAVAAHAGHGYWNDPDMLVTGEQGLSPDEQQTHFALWCIMSAPLMIGSDPRHMIDAERNLLLNREAIAIDQDSTEQGRRIRQTNGTEVWLKHLKHGRLAVLLVNRDAKETRQISFTRTDGGPKGTWIVRDVFSNKDLKISDGRISLSTPPHGSHLLIVSRGSK